jgi:hypothetical protein
MVGQRPRAPDVRHDISVAQIDFLKIFAQVPFNISRSIVSIIKDEAASPRKQWFLIEHITNLMFWATRNDEPNGDIGIQGDLANQCKDLTLRLEVFAFIESVDDDYSRAKRDRKESDWFNDETPQLDSSGHIGEGKVLHHGPIDRLEHTIHVHCKLVGKGGK